MAASNLWRLSRAVVSAGAKAYFFDEGTTTPRTTYQDDARTTAHAHPIVADASGRFPAVFLQYGDHRERVTTSGDVLLWDDDGIASPAPPGVTTGITVETADVLQCGDIIWSPIAGTRAGFVRCNGRTIGNASSGAAERANADTADLYAFLWNNFDDARCPVFSGRGASAAADFAANKYIVLLDFRARSPIGLDDMGSTALGALAAVPFTLGSATAGASLGGEATHTLATAELPAHAHSFAGDALPGHAHETGLAIRSDVNVTGAGVAVQAAGGSFNAPSTSVSAGTPSGTIGNTGGGGAHNNTPRIVTGTYFIRL